MRRTLRLKYATTIWILSVISAIIFIYSAIGYLFISPNAGGLVLHRINAEMRNIIPGITYIILVGIQIIIGMNARHSKAWNVVLVLLASLLFIRVLIYFDLIGAILFAVMINFAYQNIGDANDKAQLRPDIYRKNE